MSNKLEEERERGRERVGLCQIIEFVNLLIHKFVFIYLNDLSIFRR